MNRTHHLKKTYLQNIQCCVNTDAKCQLEFILLNFNSSDDIDDYIKSNNDFNEYDINFRCIRNSSAKYFDMSRTKNILGKYATGDILCWIDADNFIYDNFVNFIHTSFSDNNEIIMSVAYSQYTSGMCGRVVCTKSHFQKIGGYDESMKGWGYEEIDFTTRSVKCGVSNINIPTKYMGKLNHTDDERLKNYEPLLKYKLPASHSHHQMKFKSNYENFRLSSSNIKKNILIANKDSNWGLL
jgi:hypothetical protein